MTGGEAGASPDVLLTPVRRGTRARRHVSSPASIATPDAGGGDTGPRSVAGGEAGAFPDVLLTPVRRGTRARTPSGFFASADEEMKDDAEKEDTGDEDWSFDGDDPDDDGDDAVSEYRSNTRAQETNSVNVSTGAAHARSVTQSATMEHEGTFMSLLLGDSTSNTIGIQSVNAIEFDKTDALDPNVGAFDAEQCLDSQSDVSSSDDDSSDEGSDNESDLGAVAAVVEQIANENVNLNIGGMSGMIHSVFVCRNDCLRVCMLE